MGGATLGAPGTPGAAADAADAGRADAADTDAGSADAARADADNADADNADADNADAAGAAPNTGSSASTVRPIKRRGEKLGTAGSYMKDDHGVLIDLLAPRMCMGTAKRQSSRNTLMDFYSWRSDTMGWQNGTIRASPRSAASSVCQGRRAARTWEADFGGALI
jgi:hypothetical protein